MSEMTKRLIAVAVVASIAAAAIGYTRRDGAAPPVTAAATVATTAAERTPAAARTPRTTDLRTAVRDATAWPLPAEARLPGVGDSRLSASLEDWIASLPAADQERARGYAARYAPAYEIGDKAVQAWLLERGFPSLEEFAAFDYARDAASCPPRSCANPKIAALSADHFIAQMEQALPPAGADGRAVLDGLDEATRRTAAQAYLQSGLYVDRLRDSGNVLFAAYLNARREKTLGHDSRVAANRLFIAACGDPRMTLDPGQTTLAMALLQNAHGSPCNNVGLSPFPAPGKALAAHR